MFPSWFRFPFCKKDDTLTPGTESDVAPPLVLFDADHDGFTAAWVAYKKFGQVEAKPVYHSEDKDEPPYVKGRDVIILDRIWPREVVEKMKLHAKSFVLIDHHKTAVDELQGVEGCYIDTSYSAARLAFQHFFPGKKIPALVAYVDDHDRWKFNLPYSKSVYAFLRIQYRTFDQWDALHKQLKWSMKKIIEQGNAILDFQKVLVAPHIRNPRIIELCGHKVPMVNATVMASEIGHELAKNHPFGITWFQTNTGKFVYNLRASEGSEVDVSEVALEFGGGGHAKAAGFSLDRLL
jgi:oligoribonuclease NrnB/cAMP/cGMP phosphodiesterase (DHH superfamily)